ncbi:potassium/sodium hyperpolarization-activated cyclic nucleotide-gated channel 1-like isoform X2 [Sitophilus oryzae]|uniref:Potassium/sodium hyperpolarization-activated cyclic nucleotide-gated channel 1-like isoform X2 n=1 Tax=Sitophilus oryzae TaxID=7048 RepID=A0A6J2XYG5_SITOR|nr:potassium/sodium hyperpolarization-activated cyclic nucleotide-gated channel 1-like isoform X2 [Sitophilus oryzae]
MQSEEPISLRKLRSSKDHIPYKMSSYYAFVHGKWASIYEKHSCGLIDTMKQTDIVSEVIDSGGFIETRRKLIRMFMVNDKHPYTRRVFRSGNDIRNEEVRHALRYMWMLHPFSVFCLYYQYFMAVIHIWYLCKILLVDFALIGVHLVFKIEKMIVDSIMCLSMFTTFWIGYYDSDQVLVIFEPKQVAKRYLKSFFFFDLLSVIPTLVLILEFTHVAHTYPNAIKWLSLFRLVHYTSIEEAIRLFRLQHEMSSTFEIVLNMILKIYCVYLLSVSILFYIDQYSYTLTHGGHSEEEDHLPSHVHTDDKKSLQAMYRAAMLLFKISRTSVMYSYYRIIEYTITCFLAIVVEFWLIAKIYVIWQRYLVTSSLGEDKFQQLSVYMTYKGLPPDIREQIYRFFDFKFQKRFYDEQEILHMLTENLRKELPKYRLELCMSNIQLIRLLPNKVLAIIVSGMNSTFYCPGDIIVRNGTQSDNLYYVKTGTTALFDENDKEV